MARPQANAQALNDCTKHEHSSKNYFIRTFGTIGELRSICVLLCQVNVD